MLARLLNERFPNVPGDMQREHVVKSNKAEQWANVRKFHYYLRILSGVARRFETMSLNCSIESLTRLASQRTEITNQERFIDQYFDLLKNGTFDENTSVDILKRSVETLQVFLSIFKSFVFRKSLLSMSALPNMTHAKLSAIICINTRTVFIGSALIANDLNISCFLPSLRKNTQMNLLNL